MRLLPENHPKNTFFWLKLLLYQAGDICARQSLELPTQNCNSYTITPQPKQT